MEREIGEEGLLIEPGAAVTLYYNGPRIALCVCYYGALLYFFGLSVFDILKVKYAYDLVNNARG